MEGVNSKMNIEKQTIKDGMKRYLKVKHGVTLDNAKEYQIFNAISLTVMEQIVDNWNETTSTYNKGRMAYYLSAEYLGLNGLFTNILTILSLVELGIGPAMTFSLYKPLAEKTGFFHI